MKVDKAAELLSQASLFRDLEPGAIQQLAERSIERTYKKGQLLFHQGDTAQSLFVVIEGLVKISVTSEDGEEMVLVTLRPPDNFGEIGLIDGRPRSASAETLDRTTLLELGRGPFLTVLKDSPSMTDALLRSLGGVLRRLTEQTSDLVFLDLHGRVAKFLVGMAEARGSHSDEIALDLEVTQTDLAKMVGGSRQSVNQILRSFERRGYLETNGRKFVIKNIEKLRGRAGL